MIEIEVYGGSEYVIQALKMVSATVSFSDFNTIVFAFTILGIFIISAKFIFMQRLNALIFPIVAACLLYFGLTTTKTTVLVHDLVKNKDTEVYKVPVGLAILVSFFSSMENGLKEITASAAGPINDPVVIGKGEGFEMMADLDNLPILLRNIDKNSYRSLIEYMDECLRVEIGLNRILQENLGMTNDLWGAMESKNAAIFTTLYDNNGVNNVMSCKAAYILLTGKLTSAVKNAGIAYCASKDYDPVLSTAKCNSDITTIVNTYVLGKDIDGVEIDATRIFMNIVAADAYINSSASIAWKNTQEYSANQAYAKTIGGQYQATLAASKWIPALMGMYRGITISIFPLIILFVWISPIRTVTWYLGSYVMLLIWNVFDTLVLSYYLYLLKNSFADVHYSGLGINQLLAMPPKAMMMVTQFGAARWGGMTFAAAMTVGILGLSGHAISQFTRGSAGKAEENSTSEGSKSSGLGGQERTYKEGMETGANINEARSLKAVPQFEMQAGMGSSKAQDVMAKSQLATRMQENFGEDINVAENTADSAYKDSLSRFAKSDMLTDSDAVASGRRAGSTEIATQSSLTNMANQLYEGNTQKVLDNQKMNNNKLVVDDEIKNNLKSKGFDVSKGDIIDDIKFGQDNKIEQLKVSGTKDSADYIKTFGADGQKATDIQSRKTGQDYRNMNIDSYLKDHSNVEDTSTKIDNSYLKDNSNTVRNRTQIDEGNEYTGALQGVIEENSLAVQDWSNSVNNFNAAQETYHLRKTSFENANVEDKQNWENLMNNAKARMDTAEKQMVAKEMALTRSLAKDMSDIRVISDQNSQKETIVVGSKAYAKGDVTAYAQAGGKIPFTEIGAGARVSGSIGHETSNASSKDNSHKLSVQYDQTYKDISDILKTSRNEGNSEDNVYSSMNQYVNKAINESVNQKPSEPSTKNEKKNSVDDTSSINPSDYWYF